MPAMITKEKCSGCGVCVNLCPYEVFSFDDSGSKAVVTAASKCVCCFMCEDNCKFEAIAVKVPKKMYPYWP